DTIQVQLAAPTVHLGPDVPLCPGNDTSLTALGLYATLLWSTGAATPTIAVNAPGTYWATAQLDGCTASDTVQVLEAAALPPAPAADTVGVCPGELVLLSAAAGAAGYVWSTGALGPTTQVDGPGTYTVTLTGLCGTRTDTLVVRATDRATYLYVPNAVTPDGDGINDTFGPILSGPVRSMALDIFDRWGELLVHTTDPDAHWDGQYQGNAVPDGVYVWKLHYLANCGSGPQEYHRFGQVTVLR
ncbi:MAG TPA: gliding motility-associated C-terminal domain-containing protein, partial [Flavobacteriales bacterium]|nr:gliding motility-associated C-terminal domain-containing protein [Flavobacteriales bacterium]